MEGIYHKLRLLAKSITSQNLFIAAKEINGIRLFHNSIDFSKLQLYYISNLYNYDSINRDIIVENISKHVLDSEIYEDAYLMYKQKNRKKIDTSDDKQKDVNLVVSNKIKFPNKRI
jgi:hypothetical protein